MHLLSNTLAAATAVEHQCQLLQSQASCCLPSGDLDLEAAQASNKGSKSCQCLFATASNPHQHGTAPRLGEHSSNAADVLNGILKQDCVTVESCWLPTSTAGIAHLGMCCLARHCHSI